VKDATQAPPVRSFYGGDPFAGARAIADAVLYEGYVLYPYRASSRKNQLRWQFGVLVPRAFSEADGYERWSVRTECLVEPEAAPVLSVRVRCLQVQHRYVESVNGAGEPRRVGQLEVDGRLYVEWDEAVEQVVDLPLLPLAQLRGAAHVHDFGWGGGEEVELLGSGGAIVGRVIRRREPARGRATVAATANGQGPWVKVAVTLENTTTWAATSSRREEVMDRSIVAAHTMLALEGGRFVSLLAPPRGAEEAAQACHNDGTFPVLVGDDDAVVLSSPIILYDHPEVAPESSGDLYDATEIDEILALRVLTLTDEERAEARGTDPRAAAVIERVDGFGPEVWDRLHGAVRSTGSPRAVEEISPAAPWWEPAADEAASPWEATVVVAGTKVGKGSRVRLHPSHRADAQDLFLGGLPATVAGVFTDVDGGTHVAVTVEDDPATEALRWQGRYLFFHPDEVEPLPGPGVER